MLSHVTPVGKQVWPKIGIRDHKKGKPAKSGPRVNDHMGGKVPESAWKKAIIIKEIRKGIWNEKYPGWGWGGGGVYLVYVDNDCGTV